MDRSDEVAAAVIAVAGVHRLHAGTYGEVATHLPGRSVEGVRILDDLTEVHLVVNWDADVRATADAVRRIVASMVGTPVDVYVEDVAADDPPAGVVS